MLPKFPLRIAGSIALAVLAAGPGTSAAQTLSPKRTVPEIPAGACATAENGSPATPPATQRQEAERLRTAATQAALLGDPGEAGVLLERAARLNPTAAGIAYQLAGVLEELGDSDAAALEYCRYLALAPDAPDVNDVRIRIEALSGGPRSAVSEDAARSFRSGLTSFDQGLHEVALGSFSAATRLEPEWAEAYYNRGLAQLALGSYEQAAADLQRYLELSDAPADQVSVLLAITALRSSTGPGYSAPFAFWSSFVIPGLGHMYTRRPVTGFLFGAASVGAVMFGIFWDTETDAKSPYLWQGVGVGAAIAVIAAFDAYRGARRRNEGRSSTVRIVSGDGPLELLPAPVPGSPPGGLALLRLRF